ncbi:ATP-binding cassette domain-containing protein [Microbacterium laevaniformans]|uniref:ATP-binding cassette domain-containing protein n=1 Tax=Microbacterium laevaniformans TaxID=36807 RepID=UPI003D96A8DD
MLTLSDAHVRADGSATSLLSVDRLEIAPGERVVVTGASGSGKTLLLSVIAGRLRPGLTLSGSRRVTGVDRVGVVPQRGIDALHPLVRLERQLSVVTGASRARVSTVLARVGLDDARVARRRPAELSGGQAQRAAIALAVLTDAPWVIADEPTSALDPRTRDEVLAVLAGALSASASATSPALVVSTHDPVVAATLDARRLEVAGGRIVRDVPAGKAGT